MEKAQILKFSKLNTDAIMEQCEDYRPILIKYCMQYFDCDYNDGTDIVQNTYVALYENLVSDIQISNYKAWLYKVTINYGNKYIKEKLKRKEYDFVDNEEKESVLENSLQYNPDYVDNMVSDIEIERQALKIVSSLNKDEQILYTEYYCKHKKLNEIATTINISPQTIKKRHQRLKAKLLQKVKDFENF